MTNRRRERTPSLSFGHWSLGLCWPLCLGHWDLPGAVDNCDCHGAPVPSPREMSTSSALPPVWSTSSGASHAEVPAAHSGTSVGQFHRMHYAASLFPLTGGALL